VAMRIQFDKYLDAADGLVKAFKAALKALHVYTAECTTNLVGVKDAFSATARVERQTHAVLKEVWTTVLPLVGELIAKIEDCAYLLLLAQADRTCKGPWGAIPRQHKYSQQQFCSDRDKRQLWKLCPWRFTPT